MGNRTNNWINEIQNILHSIGMSDVWLCQFGSDERTFYAF